MSILKRNRIVGGFLLTVSILSSMSVLIIPVNAYTATDSTKTACQTLSGLSSLFYYNTGKWKKAIRGPDLDSAKSSISDSLMSALE